MNLAGLVTDPYNRRARLQPALLALLPVGLVALVLFPGVGSKSATLLGIAAYFGGATWLTQVGRELGKRLEPKLFNLGTAYHLHPCCAIGMPGSIQLPKNVITHFYP